MFVCGGGGPARRRRASLRGAPGSRRPRSLGAWPGPAVITSDDGARRCDGKHCRPGPNCNLDDIGSSRLSWPRVWRLAARCCCVAIGRGALLLLRARLDLARSALSVLCRLALSLGSSNFCANCHLAPSDQFGPPIVAWSSCYLCLVRVAPSAPTRQSRARHRPDTIDLEHWMCAAGGAAAHAWLAADTPTQAVQFIMSRSRPAKCAPIVR